MATTPLKKPAKEFYIPSKKLEQIVTREQSTILFNLEDEYKLDGYLDEDGLDFYKSSIIIPYQVNDIKYASIFYSKKRSFYTQSDRVLLEKLIPVVKQAINKSLYIANLVSKSKLASFGEMSAGIAHEINNPLMIIISNLNLMSKLLDEKSSLDAEKVQKLKGLITNSHDTTKRVSAIVDGMQNLSREKQLVNEDQISINDLISHSLELCQIKLKSKNIKVEVDIPLELGKCLIQVDTIQLSQVIINLISNSIDSIQDKDEQWIKLNCYIEDKDLNKKIIINVIDSGNGISLNEREKIFQPFHTTKKFQQGTGLGLSISRTIIEKMFGKIYVNSNFANTCFSIELPASILVKELIQ